MIKLDLGTYVIKIDGCVQGVIITEAPDDIVRKYCELAIFEFKNYKDVGVDWIISHLETDGFKSSLSFIREVKISRGTS